MTQLAKIIVAALGLSFYSPAGSLASDLSEAVRLWKFTYQKELAAYGLSAMGASERRATAARLDQLKDASLFRDPAFRACVTAAGQLADVYRQAGADTTKGQLKEAKAAYVIGRLACLETLGARAGDYPLEWPD